MSHEPPVPAGNQSPYPLHEPQHPHPAPLPPARSLTTGSSGAGPLAQVPGIGVVAAVGVALLAGIGALLFSRRSKASGPRPRKRKDKRPAKR